MNLQTFLDPILTVVGPALAELIALGLSLLFGWLLLTIRTYFGVRAQAVIRDALNQALTTGVKVALEKNQSPDAIAGAAVEYAKKSSPDAIKTLGAIDDVLVKKAKAILASMK